MMIVLTKAKDGQRILVNPARFTIEELAKPDGEANCFLHGNAWGAGIPVTETFDVIYRTLHISKEAV